MFIIYNHPSISDYIYKFVNLFQTVFPFYDNILYNIRIYKDPYVLQKPFGDLTCCYGKNPPVISPAIKCG